MTDNNNLDNVPTIKGPDDIKHLLQGANVFLESPYADETNEGVKYHLAVASYYQSELYRWGVGAVFAPHLCYSQLPEHVNFPERGGDILRATCYYPGKAKGWRDFTAFREAADRVVFVVLSPDGPSPGMAKVMATVPKARRVIIDAWAYGESS